MTGFIQNAKKLFSPNGGSSGSGSGTVTSVNSGTGITVDNTNPAAPIINVTGAYVSSTDYRFGSDASISASAIDWATSTSFYKTLSANTTFTFSNATNGKTIIVVITNTASNYTVTWPTVLWSGGVAPTQTIGAKTDVYTFTQLNGVLYGSVVPNCS